ncbi:uracil-DNA glycosylase family protein [Mycobacterium sp. 050128]|uniref:uracil-DNA glycosylase family protein n=1 Tax=Mycobacterium sp. 050128 TaxID=3096112 RepID=UPI003FA53414
MIAAKASAERYLPQRRSLRSLAAAAERCEGCSLFENATQTVFGRGKAKTPIMLGGEPRLLAEIEALRPQVIVCLGATAAQAILGATAAQALLGASRLRAIAQRGNSAVVVHAGEEVDAFNIATWRRLISVAPKVNFSCAATTPGPWLSGPP